MTEAERADRIAACRARFREAGLPLLDREFTASTNVFNRAAPLLALVFLGEMLGAIQLDWSPLANVAAALGGLAILLGVWMVLNRIRAASAGDAGGRRQGQLAAFVIVPALLPLIFGNQGRSAIGTALANLALLALIYAVLGYGLFSIVGWVFRRLMSQLQASVTLLARAVPLLMIFALLAFMSTEMWQVFSLISDGDLLAIALLFVSLGTGFLLARLPREVRSLEAEVGSEAEPLETRQRRNVGLILFTSQAIQVLVVSALVAAFFIVFGAIAVNQAVREAWIGEAGNTLLTITVLGEQFQITSELLKVAAGLAAFTGLYFAISMLTDSTYRDEFLQEVTAELRSVFAVRADYLRLRSPSAGSPAERLGRDGRGAWSRGGVDRSARAGGPVSTRSPFSFPASEHLPAITADRRRCATCSPSTEPRSARSWPSASAPVRASTTSRPPTYRRPASPTVARDGSRRTSWS